MTTWQERIVTAVCTAMPLVIAGSMWLGQLDNRVEQLEARLAKFESAGRSPPVSGQAELADPVRNKCAELATLLASSGRDVYTKQEVIRQAMSELACFRAN